MNGQQFYTAFARLYDRVARLPGVSRVRRRVARALAPAPGDTVVDFGCGTGGNHDAVREQVGPEGTYLGVDYASGVLRIARDRAAGPRTAFLRGDATRPPVCRADAACATFLVGMLADPAGAVRAWARLVGPGGRLALLNLERSPARVAAPLNPLFRLAVRLGSPPGARSDEPAVERLERRVRAAHGQLRRLSTATVADRGALGFYRLTAGTVRPESEW
ncbi:class I SAM-dependent methyltransferase [Halobaculum sp. MBLA0143]|uniref:class I SAM-dependent methyltransferase n=1 Tax=Halobaculum sp. MBLA0143 TaxID=3079933 RepID=UPI0035261E1C